MFHNKVIKYADFDKVFPKRKYFLDNELYKKVSHNIKRKRPLLFYPTSTWDDKAMQDKSFGETNYNKAKYKVTLFGVLEDGRRASIVINDIEPYFEIKVPDHINDAEEFAKSLFDELYMIDDDDYKIFEKAVECKNDKNEYWKIVPIRYEMDEGKPFKLFQLNSSKYVKIYFDKSAHRKDAIKYVISKGLETAHDDLSCYYRVVSRDYLISFGDWIILNNYNTEEDNEYIKGFVIQVSINNIKQYSSEFENNALSATQLKKDKTMTMCWDIETYNKLNDGEIPQPKKMVGENEIDEDNWDHNIFMIGITFQWFHSNEQLLRVCLVDTPIAPHPDFLAVVCPDEKSLITAFADCFNRLTPEIIMGFNDSSYDWNWIIKRGQAYPGVLEYIGRKFDFTRIIYDDKSVFKRYKKISIKIEADINAEGNNLQMIGYIPVDVMIVFRQLYPTSEKWGLGFFLSKNKLGGKADMPYKEMFAIYHDMKACLLNGNPIDQLLDKMKLVAEYCVIDAQRCHELMKIRSVLQDKREVANISYTSIFDAFYRANGMKVRNLVISQCNLRKLKISNIQNEYIENGKYPGAWVFPPVKGLVVSKLSINERIKKARLGYQDHIEWKDLSEDDIKECINIINQMYTNPRSNDFKKLTKCAKLASLVNNFIKEPTGRPITGLDFSSLYPSLIMTYNLSPEYIIDNREYAKEVFRLKNPDNTKQFNLHKIKFNFNGREIRGWSVRHDNYIDPNKENYRFGVFPAILKELFDARKKLKNGEKGLNYWEHRKEQLLLLMKENPDKWNSHEVQKEYEEVCFNYSALDSKQRALKVFMNTFYGEAGNKKSPLFMLLVAGGITSAGQQNIKKAYDFVTEKDCKVYYGDSITGETPIIIRRSNGNILICTVEQIIDEEKWIDYPQFKPHETAPISIMKQRQKINGEIWTASGWSDIRQIIRHKTNKKLFRVCTPRGVVDITEDHSLCKLNKEQIKPLDIKTGDELLYSFPPCSNGYDLEKKLSFACRYSTQLEAQVGYYILKMARGDPYLPYIHYDKNRDDYYIILYSGHIKNYIEIIELPLAERYVYDIETADGTYLAGVGSIILYNTDSLYLSMPDHEFKEIDHKFHIGQITKLNYWEEMVRITFIKIKIINDEVNKMFLEDNGTTFLKMAYEEALFPVLFTAKKKYVGTPHISEPNFDSGVPLFIRGLELKKRGVSDILKNVCNDILKKCVSPDNILTVIEIVQDKIKEVYNTDWSQYFDEFIMTGVYKPKKNNVKMHTFRERLINERNISLIPNERTNYVIVKKYPFKYDMRGRKIKLSVGDKMELSEIARVENMEIDLDYYMEKSINGQLARFITYHPDFQIEIRDNTDIDEIKKAENRILKSARKYIDDCCKQYYTKYEDRGIVYKSMFKVSSALVQKKLQREYSDGAIIKLLGFSIDCEMIDIWLINKIPSIIQRKKYNKKYGEKYVKAELKQVIDVEKENRIIRMQDAFYANKNINILKIVKEQYSERDNILKSRLMASLSKIKNIYGMNNSITAKSIEYIQSSIDIEKLAIEKKDNISSTLNNIIEDQKLIDLVDYEIEKNKESLISGLNELKFIYYNLLSNYEYLYQIESIVEYLKKLRNKKIGYIKAPPKKVLDLTIKRFVEDSIKDYKINMRR